MKNSWYKTSSDDENIYKYISMMDKNPDNYHYLPLELKMNMDFASLAMKNNPYNYTFLPPKLQRNIEFATLLMKNSPKNYQLLPTELKYNMEFAEMAMELPSMYYYLPTELKGDIRFATIAIKYDPSNYKYLTEKIKSDINFATIAMEHNPYNYRFLPPEFKSNIEFATLAVENEPNNYEYLPPELKSNIEIARIYLNQNPYGYKILPKELKNDIELATLAMKEEDSYYNLSPELKRNIEFAKIFLNKFPYEYDHLMPELQSNIELARIAMKYNSNQNYRHLPQELKDNKEFMNSIGVDKFSIESTIRLENNLKKAKELETKYPDSQPFEIAQMAGMNIVVYHGTSERNLKFAKDAGGFTSPRYLSHMLEKSDKNQGTKIKREYDKNRFLNPEDYEKRPHSKDQVFLTTNYEYSESYARRANGQDGTRPVVIRLEIPLTSILEFQSLCGKYASGYKNFDSDKINNKIINKKDFKDRGEQYSFYNENNNFHDMVNSESSRLMFVLAKLEEIGKTELTVETFIPYGNILDIKYLDDGKVEQRRETRKRSMEESWYKTSSAFGTDPFGSSELSDKTRLSPWGHAGGDAHTGLLEPSDSNHHQNDYFSESEKGMSTEGALEELKKSIIRKRKIKEKGRLKKFLNIKKAQWGVGSPKIPSLDSNDWVTKSYDEIFTPEPDNSSKFEQLINSTVTTNLDGKEKMEIGSGFFINETMILTCAHTVIDKNSKLYVIIKEKPYKAYVWAYDTALDAAVIVIDKEYKDKVIPLRLGDSDEIKIGEKILVVGSPLGFDNVATEGIVSSYPKEVPDSKTKIFFISSEIYPGNSGGPVFEKKSDSVVGISSVLISVEENSSGLNGVTPINTIKDFLNKNKIKYLNKENKNV